ncbi:DNA/RNA helicase domain-containing protein [Brachybacterium sp. UNK5269]|uniref:DNA/RNA helicase domain-containing protein n=1 Tax=Brachybacterium sp. UNK5269 TaxID=3408576 RepID=UPI003BB02426
MTSFDVESVAFDDDILASMERLHPRFKDWPVVYTIDNQRDVYVGESQHVAKRMRQHRANPDKQNLRRVRVIVDERFNKSACLDLESTLIRWFSGDEKFMVMNRNDGIVNPDYYRRDEYRETFEDVFEALRQEGLFSRTIPEIENSDLFKLSPYKALNSDQAVAVEAILEGLRDDLEADRKSLSVVQGDPGTGKTIVGIYLTKLLRDIAEYEPAEDLDPDSMFSEFFFEGTREHFQHLRIGLVVPQQSLRGSIASVFKKTPALQNTPVLTAFDVGKSVGEWDVLIVDEAHRLNQYSAQAMGTQTRDFRSITESLFGSMNPELNQLDWIRKKAKHTVLLLDTAQSVRPSDIEPEVFETVVARARTEHRHYPLLSQMRVAGGNDYIDFVRRFLSDDPPTEVPDFGEYDFRIFDHFGAMVEAIEQREREAGLSRLVAGYAWKWASRKDKAAYDIEIDGLRFRWNQRQVDWINSPTSAEEVGSIHTVQGYDLNYAGVIFGQDLQRDPRTGELFADKRSYFDQRGKSNNTLRDRPTTVEDLARYIRNVYSVLMTRGIKGTYVYAPHLVAAEHMGTMAAVNSHA